MSFKKIAFTIVSVLMTVSCLAGNLTVKPVNVTGRILSFPPAYYDSVVYIEDRLIAFTFDITQRNPVNQTSFTYEGDNNLYPFNPQHLEHCDNFNGYVIKGRLPDGRIGFLGCNVSGGYLSILALDWETGQVEKLVNGRLPGYWSPKDFTWNPQMTRGVQEMVDGAQGTIYWITPEGSLPMDIEIEDKGLKWNLKTYYENRDTIDKGVGLVYSPAWSPDGKTIAFFVSTYGVKEVPQLRPNIRSELYFMDPSTLKPVQMLQDVTNGFLPRWSPDSKQLLFNGCMGIPSRCGLWIYTLDDKSLSFIAEGEFQDFIWVTDRKIAAVKILTYVFENDEIWEYTLDN